MNTRLYELQLLYSNRAGNGIGFSKGEMEGGEGDGGGQGVGDGGDSAGRARRAFEDDWTTAWGGVGGVASGGGGVSGNGRYIECNIDRVSER